MPWNILMQHWWMDIFKKYINMWIILYNFEHLLVTFTNVNYNLLTHGKLYRHISVKTLKCELCHFHIQPTTLTNTKKYVCMYVHVYNFKKQFKSFQELYRINLFIRAIERNSNLISNKLLNNYDLIPWGNSIHAWYQMSRFSRSSHCRVTYVPWWQHCLHITHTL